MSFALAKPPLHKKLKRANGEARVSLPSMALRLNSQGLTIGSSAMDQQYGQDGHEEGNREGGIEHEGEEYRGDELKQHLVTIPEALTRERRRDERLDEVRKNDNCEDEDKEGVADESMGPGGERGGPDTEGKYNWEAEAQKPVEEKGLQSDGWRAPFKFRKMIWERREARWWGRWTWSEREEEDVWEKRVKDGWERAVRAWNVADAPQEVLLRVIECLVGQRLSFAREIEDAAKTGDYLEDPPSVKGLRNIALVCLAWCTLVSPALYSNLHIREPVSSISAPPLIAQHARRITVRSTRPYTTSAKFLQTGPRPSPAVWLAWVGSNREGASKKAVYDGPSQAVFYAQLHRSYSNVVRLDLRDCNFLWSSDLLRLLVAFSVLQRVNLERVTVDHITQRIVRPGRPITPIRNIYADQYCTSGHLPFLTEYWTWPSKPSDRPGPPFHGLLPAEQQLVASVSKLVTGVGSTSYRLDPMDHDGRAWVATSWTSAMRIEYHMSRDGSQQSAYIHHCLLRVADRGDVDALTHVAAIGDIFNRFTILETVVLETGWGVATDDIQALLESLRKVCRVEVQHGTCDEGHKLALQTKKSSSRSASAGLLSPFWCLQEHAEHWKFWLSEDYWKTLKDEDKQGWDPSRPPATSPASFAS